MLDLLKRYYKTIFDLSILIGIVFLLMWLGSYIFNIAAPIVYGYIFYLLIEPFARFLNRKGMKKSLATGLSMLCLISIFLATIFISGIIFIDQTKNIVESFPRYVEMSEDKIKDISDYIKTNASELSPETLEKISSLGISISSNLLETLKNWFPNFIKTITSIPTLIFQLILGLILAYFLSLESDNWVDIVEKKLPKTLKEVYKFVKEKVFVDIIKYIKAQSILIGITFIIILAGLTIFKVENAFSISVISAIFDILPLLGVATIFLPWILYVLFISGNVNLAIGLSIIWLIVILFRQIGEPKIVGDSLGISAFAMLSLMVIFLSIFGIAGMLLTPILTIILKELYVGGYFQKWIRKPEGEY